MTPLGVAAWCARPTRLSGGDDISSLQDSGDCVGLDRGWIRVSAEGDVFDHDRVQASSLELVQGERLKDEQWNVPYIRNWGWLLLCLCGDLDGEQTGLLMMYSEISQ